MTEEEASCCAPGDAGKNSCKVEAVVSVDERGQMVLPKELRDRGLLHLSDQGRGALGDGQGLFRPYFQRFSVNGVMGVWKRRR